MTQIAGQAGVSRRTLYLHYKDKEDLAAELYVDNLERMFGRLLFDFDFARPVPSLEKILDQYLALREHEEALIYYDALFGVYYSTLSKNPAELPDFKRAMEVWYSRYINLETAAVAPEHQKSGWIFCRSPPTSISCICKRLLFCPISGAVPLRRKTGQRTGNSRISLWLGCGEPDVHRYSLDNIINHMEAHRSN